MNALIISVLVLLSSCCTGQETCGRPVIAPVLDNEDRILGGSEAVPGSWPWLAPLYEHPILGGDMVCSGALLDSQHVVTAAHCVRSVHRSMLRIHLGVHTRDRRDVGEQTALVQHICAHRLAYKPYNDIAILRLRRTIKFRDTIQPVCLPQPDGEMPDNVTLYVTGWGKTQATHIDVEDRSLTLKQLRVPSLSSETCRSQFLRFLLDSGFCGAHEYGSTCNGDSGAPAVRLRDGVWTLEGITAGGPRTCGIAKSPMRFTKVSWFVNWIRRYMNSSEAEWSVLCRPADVSLRATRCSSLNGLTVEMNALIISVLVLLPSCCRGQQTCGRPAIAPMLDNEDRIMGGSEAVAGSWPWQAALYEHPLLGGNMICSGALLDSQHVLTIAHCLRSVHRSTLRVHLGVHTRDSRDNGEETALVQHICTHRLTYKSYNDIAILRLRSPIKFRDTIQPVCLPLPGTEMPDNATLYVTGWGKTRATDIDVEDMSSTLKQLRVPSLSSETCRSQFLEFLLDSSFCGTHEYGSACHGDSGAPAVRLRHGVWTLKGLAAGGPRTCGTATSPMHFTKVSWFVNWIHRYMNSNAAEWNVLCRPSDV
ncbi:tryptase gamma-like [Ornithodoros turicata]|uniref:tryptase gamma-like n=1 Tax=Ornithodoros turicata TaxID=34597 RepID=UPI0031396792